MIRRLHAALPGPPLTRSLLLVVIAVVALAALIGLYEWLGSFLDSGGGIG